MEGRTRMGDRRAHSRASYARIGASVQVTRGNQLLVNVVTKAGTNNFGGTASGFFRDDRFNAADPVIGRVLEYSNQQLAGTFGGPIRRDTAHFFGYYETEREPQTIAFNSRFPGFNIPDLTATRLEHKLGGRFDTQFSAARRLMVRGNRWIRHEPFATSRCPPAATRHPSTPCGGGHTSTQACASFTQILVVLCHIQALVDLDEVIAITCTSCGDSLS